MLGDIKKLGQDSLVYGLSTVVARLLNFLLLPFYTHYLLPGEYGIVAILFTYIAFSNIFFQYGMDQAYLRFAAGKGETKADSYFMTAQATLALTAVFFALPLYLFAAPIGELAAVGPDGATLIRYGAGILALDALTIVPFADLRLRRRTWAFAGIKVFNISVNVIMNILLLGHFHLGVRGVFIAALLAASSSVVLLAPVAAMRLTGGRPSAKLLSDLLKFGLPFVPAGLGAMMVQVIDRPILQRMTDDATVGIYQANYRLGIFMMLLVTMFDQAWRPFFLEHADDKGAKEMFGRVLTYFLTASVAVVAFLSLFIEDIVRIPLGKATLIHPAYWEGLPVVPVVLSAYIFHGAYINFIASITLSKRTDLLIWATMIGAGVNIAANFALIPSLGMMGAAWATFFSYAAMALCLYLMGRRVYPIPYEIGRIGHLFAAATATAGAAMAASGAYAHAGGLRYIFAKGAVFGLLPILLLGTGFFTAQERRAAGAFFKRINR